jgi:transposase-like protein
VIARWALAGYSAREIGKRVGVPRRTVTRWMQDVADAVDSMRAEAAVGLTGQIPSECGHNPD